MQRLFQHMRSDFQYEGDDLEKDGFYMIYPEFIQEDGSLRDIDASIPDRGIANMWILFPEMRQQHRSKVQVGVEGYLMIGATKLAKAVISDVLALNENPDE